MQPEQQKRILGYFIEEAKEHLETIEHSLLNLQAAIDDPEMLNEVFRAAHSVKGGAAMLGIYSIQQISHKLEDYFKLLKEHPIQADQKLEALFLQSFDPLRDLLEELQSPFGVSDAVSEKALAQVEPVFAELHKHLSSLIHGGAAPAPAAPSYNVGPIFQAEVPNLLRQMLQLFKQGDNGSERHQVVTLCDQMEQMGHKYGLNDWTLLMQTAGKAAANPDNAFMTLAPVLIREIKAASDQIVAGQRGPIAPSAQMQALLPVPAPEPEPQQEAQPEPMSTAPQVAPMLADPWEVPEAAAPPSEPEQSAEFYGADSHGNDSHDAEADSSEANSAPGWVIETLPAAEFESPEPISEGDLAGQIASLYTGPEEMGDVPDFDTAMAAIPSLIENENNPESVGLEVSFPG